MSGQKDGFSGERAIVLPPAAIREMENHPFGSQLHITDIGYYPVAKNHYRGRSIPIPQWILIFCRAGKGWYSICDKRFDVGADSYFVLPPGIPHAYGSAPSDPWTIYWVHYRGVMAPDLLDYSSGPIYLGDGPNNRVADRISIFEEIMSSLERGFSRDALLYASSSLAYFISTLKYSDYYKAVKNFDSENTLKNESNIVDILIRYMTENIERPIRLSDLSEYVGLTPSYLSHIFTLRTGSSPINYLRQLRVSHACHLLDFSTLKINQICHKIGIEDPYYFSRMFSSIMGVSPSEYRKRPKG